MADEKRQKELRLRGDSTGEGCVETSVNIC